MTLQSISRTQKYISWGGVYCNIPLYASLHCDTLLGTPDFTPFGEFIISPIHYNIHYIIFSLNDYAYGLMTLVCLPVGLLYLVLILFHIYLRLCIYAVIYAGCNTEIYI